MTTIHSHPPLVIMKLSFEFQRFFFNFKKPATVSTSDSRTFDVEVHYWPRMIEFKENGHTTVRAVSKKLSTWDIQDSRGQRLFNIDEKGLFHFQRHETYASHFSLESAKKWKFSPGAKRFSINNVDEKDYLVALAYCWLRRNWINN